MPQAWLSTADQYLQAHVELELAKGFAPGTAAAEMHTQFALVHAILAQTPSATMATVQEVFIVQDGKGGDLNDDTEDPAYDL
jgi:hypothetical protein